MKKLIYSLMALAMVAVSCQKDAGSLDYEGKDTVAVTIGVGVQELDATRSGETDMNSGLGAIDNFDADKDADEWEKYDVRYIMEIYDVTEGFENLNTPIKKREVKTYDKYEETMFSVRLIPNRDYRFVFWADFVNENSEDDLHYNTTDLKAVTRFANAVAMDECQDAYFVQKDLKVGSNGIEESVVLKRPFGKIRVITTDYDDVNIGSEPKKVVVKFYNHNLLTTLNAVTGVAEGKTLNVYTYEVTKETSPYTKGYDEEEQNMTLFSDYILAADETVGAQEVNFTIEVTEENGRVINSHDFNTQIPLERNHLTTIVGNLLTLKNDISISIDDNFDGEYVRDWDDEAVVPAEKQVNLTFFTDNGTSYVFNGDDGHNYLIAFRNVDPGTFSLTDSNKFITTGCTWTANNTTYFGGTQFAEGDTLELIKNGTGSTATFTIIIRATVDGEKVVATCANTNFQ